MWELMQNVTRGVGRPVRKQSTMGAFPALLLGAGVGIATWEIVRRRTGITSEYAATAASDRAK